jgi:hypothetical protein
VGIIELAKKILREEDSDRVVYIAAVNDAPWLRTLIENELATRDPVSISVKFRFMLANPGKFAHPGSIMRPGFLLHLNRY